MDSADDVIAQLRRSAESAQRVLDAASGTHPAWAVRYSWEVISGLSHPEHTFASHWTESKAIDAAIQMLRNFDNRGGLKLTAAHVRGPGGSVWIRVE